MIQQAESATLLVFVHFVHKFIKARPSSFFDVDISLLITEATEAIPTSGDAIPTDAAPAQGTGAELPNPTGHDMNHYLPPGM